MDRETRDLINRFDEHLGRFDQHLARFDEHLKRSDEHLKRSDAIMERNTQAFEHYARSEGKLIAALDSIRTTMVDMSDQLRTNTQAVLHVLDRLDGRGSQA
jgi:hypothetical protein